MRTALCVQPPEKGSSAAPVRASPCFDGRSDGPQMAMPLAGRDEVCPGSGVERPFSWSQSIVVPAKRGWARWRPVAVSQNPHQRTRPKLGGGQRSPESGRGVTHQQRDCMHRMRHSHLHTPICTHTYTHLHTHTQRYTSAKSLRGAKRVCTLATYCPPRGMEHIYTHTHRYRYTTTKKSNSGQGPQGVCRLAVDTLLQEGWSTWQEHALWRWPASAARKSMARKLLDGRK